jgi:hypothetical protein
VSDSCHLSFRGRAVVLCLAAILVCPAIQALAEAQSQVTYVYSTDTATRDAFVGLLLSRSLTVRALSLSSVASSTFAFDDAIVIGPDTAGYPTPAWPTAAKDALVASHKPVVGIGVGGALFFTAVGGLGIDYGQSWLLPARSVVALRSDAGSWTWPNLVDTSAATGELALYASDVTTVAAYFPSENVDYSRLGRQTDDAAHFPLLAQATNGTCYSLWGFNASPSTMTQAGRDLFSNLVRGNPCSISGYSLTSRFTGAAPVIDGVIATGEWTPGARLWFDKGFVQVQNDGQFLYVLLDVVADTSASPSSYFLLPFDVDRDASRTANVDRTYGLLPDGSFGYSYFLATPGTYTATYPEAASTMARGFGCWPADEGLSSCSAHVVYEMKIALAEIGAHAGSVAKMGLRVGSPSASWITTTPRQALNAALLSDYIRVALAPASGDYDGDGRGDIAVFSTAAGHWFLRLSRGGSTWTPGYPSDIPVPGDYDGDGRTDIAVFRDGAWYITESSSGTTIGFTWGQAGDVPVPADYDGDGKTDVAVFRHGGWYIVKSSNRTAVGVLWGGSDTPVPADYDGDGRADIAVFRPSASAWYVIPSSTGVGIGTLWGTMGDIPVVADFDADGKADIAVFRPSANAWYIVRSTGGSVGFLWGTTGDLPAVKDFDGDGKADCAVYRPGVGAWYIIQSSTGTGVGILWGGPGDQPV